MDNIELLHPHYILYSPKLVALELLFKYLDRDVQLHHGPYTTGEFVIVQGEKILAKNILEEFQGWISFKLDHFYVNQTLEQRLQEEAMVSVCTNTLEIICYHYMFLKQDYQSYPTPNPYWTIINPIKKIEFYIWKREIKEKMEQKMLSSQPNIEAAYDNALFKISNFLDKQQKDASMLTKIVIYSYIQSININTPESDIQQGLNRFPIIINFMKKFLQEVVMPIQFGQIVGERFTLVSECSNLKEKNDRENLYIQQQFKKRLPFTAIVIGTFVYTLSKN